MKKCPHCQQEVRSLYTEAVPAHALNGVEYQGVVFLCPSCRTVLGAGIDPILLANQIRQEIEKKR